MSAGATDEFIMRRRLRPPRTPPARHPPHRFAQRARAAVGPESALPLPIRIARAKPALELQLPDFVAAGGGKMRLGAGLEACVLTADRLGHAGPAMSRGPA